MYPSVYLQYLNIHIPFIPIYLYIRQRPARQEWSEPHRYLLAPGTKRTRG